MKKLLQTLTLIVIPLAFVLLFANNAYSQWKVFKKLGGAIKTTGKTLTKVTTAPYRTIYNTGKVVTGNAGPKTIYKPYTDVTKDVGTALNKSADLFNWPYNFIYSQALEYSGKFGNTGKFIFDISTFLNQLSNQYSDAGINSLSNALKGQNPAQVIGVPLAAAIKAARQRHLAEAKPLPPNIKEALLEYFPRHILDKAKYCIGDIQITLPNFIGQGQKLFGDASFAVTVDDIIVFNVTPPLYPTDIRQWKWWIHEITHIQQYSKLGVEGFAFRYVLNHGSIENEAINYANSFYIR
jgi:hypothetical protein